MLDTRRAGSAYRFGAFELEVRSGELRKHGIRIKLQEQPRQVLLLLLQHAGEAVTREQIGKHLWPDDTFVQFDNAINSAVRKLRDALGDTAENPRFVETLAKRGYRFVAPVSTNAELEPERAAEPVTKRVPRRTAHILAVSALLLIGGGAVFTTLLMRRNSPAESPDLRVTPLTANTGLEGQPSFSPDGTRVAYVWNGPEQKNFSIYVKQIGAGDPVRLTRDAARDFSPAWSPDGRWVAALRDTGRENWLLLIPASGGQHRVLAKLLKAGPGDENCVLTNWPVSCGISFWGTLLAWSPDGKYLFTSAQQSPQTGLALVRIAVETGEQRLVLPLPAGFEGDFGPAVSPNGRELAFVRLVGAKTGDLYVLPLSGAPNVAGAMAANSQVRRITFDSVDVETPAWTGDGRELIFSSTRGARPELWRIQPFGSGKPVRLQGVGEGALQMALSTDGRRLVYSKGNFSGSLWKTPIGSGKGGAPVRVTATTERDKFAHFSPDGKRIAFQSGRSGVEEIWVCDADGRNAVQLTNFRRGVSGSPSWSPDGRTIAFDSNAAGSWDIYTISMEGGRIVHLTAQPATGAIPNWSRDGRWIYFVSDRTGTGEVWKIRPEDRRQTQVTTGGGLTAMESVDGRELYFKRDSTDEGTIWKMPVGGGPPVKVLDAVKGRQFTVAEKGIYFAAGTPQIELRYFEFAKNTIRVVAPLSNWAHAVVSPDEQWVLYPSGGMSNMNLTVVENFR